MPRIAKRNEIDLTKIKYVQYADWCYEVDTKEMDMKEIVRQMTGLFPEFNEGIVMEQSGDILWLSVMPIRIVTKHLEDSINHVLESFDYSEVTPKQKQALITLRNALVIDKHKESK